MEMEVEKLAWLDEMTWEEAAEAFKKTDVAVICLGATHPHGIAAPLGTDTFVAWGMGERIGRKSNAIVLPPIPFGYNEYHMDGFPGTINVSTNVYHSFLVEVCRSLYNWGIRKLVWLSPHSGNVKTIESVAYKMRTEKNMLSAVVGYELSGQIDPSLKAYLGSEGMVDEVSMMLYLKPSTAHPDRDSGFKGEFKQTMGPKLKVLGLGIARVGGVEFKDVAVKVLTITKDVTDTASWAGEEKGWNLNNSSRELGEKIIELASDYIAEFIEEFAKVKIPPPTKFP